MEKKFRGKKNKEELIEIINTGIENSWDFNCFLKNILNNKERCLSSLYKWLNQNQAEDLALKLKKYICEKSGNKREVSKKTCDENFFKEWSCNNSWVLGFIVSDGYLYKKNKKPTLGFGSTDKDVILKIKELLNTNYVILEKQTIRDNKRYKDSWQLELYNCFYYESFLNENGITCRKSLTVEYPKNLPDLYFYDFLRGVMDGDGTICISRDEKWNRYILNLSLVSSSKSFIDKIAEKIKLFHSWDIYVGKNIEGKNPIYSIQLSGEKAYNLLLKIYENSKEENRMNRKYLKFQEALQKVEFVKKLYQKDLNNA